MVAKRNKRWAAISRKIVEAETNDFAELIALSGLDPTRHLKFAEWSDVSFRRSDLRGFDFTGARLHNCEFGGALIDGARFDQAEINGTNLRWAKDWDAHVRNWRPKETLPTDEHLPVAAVFHDAPFAPEMVIVPTGECMLRGLSREKSSETKLTIGSPFGVARYAVTFEEWDAAVAAGGVEHKPDDQGWGRTRRPVIHVSWHDAKAYVMWLSKVTRRDYRLLTQDEWEYCCRAGTTTGFDTKVSKKLARFSSDTTVEVGSFAPNGWGLHDMLGNVWEWCEDYWDERDATAVRDGKARKGGDLSLRVLRGGSWYDDSNGALRSSYRILQRPESRESNIGFRVARSLVRQPLTQPGSRTNT